MGAVRLANGECSGRRVGGVAIVVAAGVLVGVRRAESPYADTDVLWGARAGRDFLASGRLPSTDEYSWTRHGRPWMPNSWGWNVVLGAADRAAGYVGLALLGVAMMGLVALLISVSARRIDASPAWTALLLQTVAGFLALFLYPRAQIVDYAAVLLLPLLIGPMLERGRFAPFAAAIFAAQVAWMNLHSAALLGPVLVLAAGAGQVARAPGRRAAMTARVAAVTGLATLGCLATPYGLALITHVDDVREASAGLVVEWRPVGFGSVEQLLGVVAIAVAGSAAWVAWRACRLDTALVLAVLATATATAIRFAPLAALFAVPELAAAARRIPARPFFVNRVCLLALGILAALATVNLAGFGHPGARNVSDRLVAALPSGCRLLNDYRVGGDVILNRPDVPVSIDSRNDLYGREKELESIRQLAYPAVGLAYIRSTDVTCVLAPTKAPLVQRLRSETSWHVVGEDTFRTLLVRRAAG